MGRVWRFLCALWEHISTWERKAGVQQLRDRLRLCWYCDARDGDWCTQCGCYIPLKATWLEQRCPIEKW